MTPNELPNAELAELLLSIIEDRELLTDEGNELVYAAVDARLRNSIPTPTVEAFPSGRNGIVGIYINGVWCCDTTNASGYTLVHTAPIALGITDEKQTTEETL